MLKGYQPYPSHWSTRSYSSQNFSILPSEKFHHPYRFSMAPRQRTWHQWLWGQPLWGDFKLLLFFESLKVSIPSELLFYGKIKNFKGSLCSLLVALTITSSYMTSSSSMHSLHQKSFNRSLRLEKFNTSTCLHTPCMALCYTCTSVGMRTTISLLNFLR